MSGRTFKLIHIHGPAAAAAMEPAAYERENSGAGCRTTCGWGLQWSPLLMSGRTYNPKEGWAAAWSLQWSPLLMSGRTQPDRGNFRGHGMLQWSPLLMSGRTGI